MSPPGNLEYILTEAFASMRRGGGRPNPLDAAYLLGRYTTEMAPGDIPTPVRIVLFPMLLAAGRFLGGYLRYTDAAPRLPR